MLILSLLISYPFLLVLSLERKRRLSLRFVEHSEWSKIEIIIIDRLIYFLLDMHLILKLMFVIFTIGTSKGKETKKPSNLVQHGECSLLL